MDANIIVKENAKIYFLNNIWQMLNIVDKLLSSYVVILWNLKSSYQLNIKQVFFVWITNSSHF